MIRELLWLRRQIILPRPADIADLLRDWLRDRTNPAVRAGCRQLLFELRCSRLIAPPQPPEA